MNEIVTHSPPQSSASQLTNELAKMLGLVAPVTMTADQQTIWLASAVDALRDIRPSEVAAVSAEVRRTVTRPSQIVPEIAKLVAAKRSERASRITVPAIEGPPPKRHIMDRDRSMFKAEDWAELNEYLERMGSDVRYRSDGSRFVEAIR